jgi:hypothetical protein
MAQSNTVLRFPRESETHRYNLIHFRFFVQYAKIAGVDVHLVDSDDKVFIASDHLVFSCTINDQQIIVDYADHSTKNWSSRYPGIPYFKFQTTAKNPPGLIPLGPPMVGVKRRGTQGATMREYNQIRYDYDYQPGHAILCKQLPNGAATERRNLVHQMLVENFESVDISADSDQIDFWRAHKRCLTAVCVPGATNNMVDRGHMELIGLGVCTISPELYTLFPGGKSLTPDRHYIRCRDDYADLIDIIKSLQADPSRSQDIGQRARKFYEKRYTPQKYWQWILENLPCST